jgi:dienelactone hydrolase
MLTVLLLAAPALAGIKETPVEYLEGETTFDGLMVVDTDSPKPRAGVVIFHQWAGPTDHERNVARDLAALGYAAFVADVYGKGVRPETQEQRVELVTRYKTDRALLRARAEASLEALAGQPDVDDQRLAAIGYCFGGTTAIELARAGAKLAGVVSFHGGLDSPTPRDGRNIRCKVLALHGADDPYVPAADLSAFESEMRTHAVDWQLVKYGGAVHAFTQKESGSDNSTGAAYNEHAAARSWQALLDFLKELFP